MQYILALFIFCIVLFVYLHINYHLKTSDDLEIFEIEQPSKNELEDICDLRQPVKFTYKNHKISSNLTKESMHSTYKAFDVKIRDVSEISNQDDILYIPLTLEKSLDLVSKDTESKYIIENNTDFLEETALIKEFQMSDDFLRPPMVSNCVYDVCYASEGATTPLRYDMNYRNFYYLVEGEINIIIIPPRCTKYLREEKDYENYEFRSPMNPWGIQDIYKNEYDKTKSLEVTIKAGEIFYIPAYWWYSIKYKNSSTLCTLKYMTYMNMITIFPHMMMRVLQTQNIKLQRAKVSKLVKKDETNQEKSENTQ